MDDLIDLLGEDICLTKKEPRTEVGVQAAPDSVLRPTDAAVIHELEMEVDTLRHCIQDLVMEIRDRDSKETPADKPSRILMKPRDIPTLELKHLRGVEGSGRLEVFLAQVENCSSDNRERQQIVQMRVDAPLALFVKNSLQIPKSWPEFKLHLIKELTDQNEEKLFDSLNELKYSVDVEPVEFVARLKCKLALLEVKTDPDNVPKKDKLIKTKLLKGMPKDSRERLELYMDENVSLQRFMRKLETERLVVMARREDIAGAVDSTPPRPLYPAASSPSSVASRPNNLERVERRLNIWPRGGKYCPYCRMHNHTVSECFKKPAPGSCFDCLRMNCKRGQSNCPGRVNMTRGRIA